ncbi:MAG: hypothetical protein ABIH77_03645 [Pseudomonadota bacterium]
MQQELENPLAQAILAGKFKAGDKIVVSVSKGQLVLKK